MKKTLIIFFSFISFLSSGQSQMRLNELKDEFQNSFRVQKARVEKFISENKVERLFKDLDGNIIELIDVDEFGKPVYISTYNAGLALTTGVTKLRSSGTLGLNLRGEGITVGIWDGGPVFQHSEFGSRLIFAEGGTISDHGTHVSGTVLASGLSSDAQGMAPLTKFYSYDWNNDRSEMVSLARPDETGLLFSNHSYGIVQGWVFQNNSWTWTGNAAVSSTEDWRFGFYTNTARDIDQVAFNSPYYSIFWAAGNDRDDTGGSVFPADGNQGSGYDCLGQEGTAKNIFTIGAIRKVTNYTDPSVVQMSAFSGWGPTDDGRIKPDLVAPGVNIISTVSGNNYASFNGTSMATPGAMGSLVLLQELHKKLNGDKPMLSATLKALAIHTAKEAGDHPGPDYSYGWGVVDVEAAAKILLGKDTKNIFVEELSLENGHNFEQLLTPKQGTKITATIAWTDPAGTPPLASLDPTNLMLVNDLDMRIVDDEGNEHSPWALNPADATLGQPAFKADNFRDNVERIEFENVEAKTYTLRINHKNTLTGGKQNFSLIISYESVNEAPVNYYWVGGSGNWDDPNHWSLQSNGLGGVGVPDQTNKAIFDEHSLVDGDEIILSQNETLGSFVWLNRSNVSLRLNSFDISIAGDLLIGYPGLKTTTNGRFSFTGTTPKSLSFSDNNLSTTSILLTGDAQYNFVGKTAIDSLEISNGEVRIQSDTLRLNKLKVLAGSESVDLSNSVIAGLELFSIAPTTTLESQNSVIIISDFGEINLNDKNFDGQLVVAGTDVTINGNNTINKLSATQNFTLLGSNVFSDFSLAGGVTLTLAQNSEQLFSGNVQLTSSENNRIAIKSNTGIANIKFDDRIKICFDFLDIENVRITGEAVVNAGTQSILNLTTLNWEKDACENVLFPDFSYDVNCAGSLITFQDLSQGLVQTREWSASEGVDIVQTNENGNSTMIIVEPGSYEITLTISNATSSRQLTTTVEVGVNDLPENTVIINGSNLFSTIAASSYQWYRDFEIITGATTRSYPFNGEPGLYFVLTENENCNRISTEALISSVGDIISNGETALFWPNPATDLVNVDIGLIKSYRILSITGGVVIDEIQPTTATIDVRNLNKGIYILEIKTKTNNLITQKLLIK